MASRKFEGKIALVTGAASGIGNTIAHYLAAQGAQVAGVDLAETVNEKIAALPGPGHQGIRVDLADPSAAQSIVDQLRSEGSSPDLLVNSAGIGLVDPAVDLPADRWQKTLDVNLSASFYMAQAAGRAMVESGYGRIVSISSQAALIGLPEHAAYAASKAGILGFTRVLAIEWAARGVTVNAISPTIVETPLGKEVWAGEKGDRAKREIPVGRFAASEEIAALVGYLLSDEAAMITGENVVIDGGRTIS